MTTPAADNLPPVDQDPWAKEIAAEFRAWREQTGVSQAQLSRMLGKGKAYVSKVEGLNSRPSAAAVAAFREIQASYGAAPAGDADGIDTPAGGSSAGPQGSASESEAGRDLPPLAESPDDHEGEQSVYTVKPGGREIRVTASGHFAKLELSMFVFFAGKEIAYAYPLPNGKMETRITRQMGLCDMLPPADGAIVRDRAAEMAHAWADWARTNSRVDAFLSFFIVEGGFKGVVAATTPVIFSILANHGVDPLSFFLGPLDGLIGGPKHAGSNGGGAGAADVPAFVVGETPPGAAGDGTLP